MSDNDQTVSLAAGVVLQVIDGEALILNLNDEVVFSLNETGARIARLIEEGQPLRVIAETLSREYDISREDAQREVEGLVTVLREQRLVISRPSK
jgi:hypothetical protein